VTLLPGENKTINISTFVGIGDHGIYVVVDRNNEIEELDESNNQANVSITVGSWYLVYGNITGTLVLESITNKTIFEWYVGNDTAGNIYVIDTDSSITWTNLTPIGKNISGHNVTNDFSEIDTALGMTNLSDSVNITYFFNNSPIAASSFIVFAITKNDTPVDNSTNTSNFVTGIFWDSSDLTEPEYNGTQDLVFVSNINMQAQGAYGTYDYEMKMPARLREYVQPNNLNTVTFYLELR